MAHIDFDKLNQIGERVKRGEVSHQDALGLAGGAAATSPRITDAGLDDHTLAARSLMNEYGVTELEARRAVAEVGIEAYRDRIDAESARVIALKQVQADADFAASPEGRIQAAEQTQLARQQKAHQVELAKVALEDGGLFSADDLAALSADELLQAAGFVQPADDGFYHGADSIEVNRAAAERSGGLA